MNLISTYYTKWDHNQYKRYISSNPLFIFIQNNFRCFNYDTSSESVSINQILVKNDINSVENELSAKQKSDSKPFISIDPTEETILSLIKLLTKQYLIELKTKTSLECCLTNGQILSAIEIIIHVFSSLKVF
jgi:hypothetical protein